MDQSTLLLGIDIGWSKKQRSCAFAAKDPKQKISWPKRTDIYGSNDLTCCRFRLTELGEFIDSVRVAMSSYERTILVLDGPLGPNGKPTSNRIVDSVFRCGEFNRRMQPADIDNDLGRTYVEATYEVANRFGQTFSPWVGGPIDSSFVVAETNPTVGLALMNRKYLAEELPSRKRPLVPPTGQSNGRAIRAKSDFYWLTGGNRLCAAILNDEKVAKERNHENVAGLYCLAVAEAIGSGNAISCGESQTGVYVFPNRIESDWHSDLLTAGIVSGDLMTADNVVPPISLDDWGRTSTVSLNDASQIFADDAIGENLASESNIEVLLLNDNGGIWNRLNDWLEGVDGPVRLQCTDGNTVIQLEKASGNNGQWKSEPKTISLARLHGFEGQHLSNKHCIAMEIKVLEVD